VHQSFNIEFIKPQLNWLKLTVMILILLTVLWAYITFFNLLYPERSISYYSLWLGIAAIIYWLGQHGIYRFGIIKERSQLRKHILDKTNSIATIELKNDHIKTFQHLLIDKKMYLNPNLTLEKFAESMKISPGHLSRIIKSDLKTNFTDIVNAKRVEAAKSYLENPKFSNYTIIAIGLEAGFNSKSAFFEVFKKSTGKTPTEYKKERNNT
jgi:AraC-like DNA-binding protein